MISNIEVIWQNVFSHKRVMIIGVSSVLNLSSYDNPFNWGTILVDRRVTICFQSFEYSSLNVGTKWSRHNQL